MRGCGWRLWGLTIITAAMGVTEVRAASAVGANCDGALMAAELYVTAERGQRVTDERFAQMVDTVRFVAAAESGDTIAEYALAGRAIQRGDQAQALRWLKRAAEHGHPDAQRDLAGRYMSGLGVPQSYVEAAGWYSRAAQQGDVAASSAMGDLHWLGQGVPQDFIEAHKWYSLAVAKLPSVAYDRDKVAAKMTEAQVEEAQRRAAAWRAVPEPSPCLEVFKRTVRERK